MKKSLLTLPIFFFSHFMVSAQYPAPKDWFFFIQSGANENKIVYPLSGDTKHLYQAVSALNYNPVLLVKDTFSGIYFPDIGNKSKTIILAARPYETKQEYQLWSSEKGGIIDKIFTNKRAADLQRFKYINFAQTPIEGPSIFSFFDSGDLSATQMEQTGRICIVGPIKNDSLPLRGFRGELAECLFFNRVLSPIELAQSETYLAIKYGITRQADYIFNNEQVIWNWRKNKAFHHEIIGVARSDDWKLYQKQSETPLLKLGLNGIQEANKSNESTISNNAYLLCGNDAGLTFFDQELSDSISFLSRTWMVVTNDIDSAFQLCFSKGKLAERATETDQYVLLINRKGEGKFTDENSELYFPISDENGFIFFNHIFFDTDYSGKDLFTLGIKHNVINRPHQKNIQFESVEIWPNPSSDGYFNIAVKSKENEPLYYQIVDPSGKIIATGQKETSNRFFFEIKLPIGNEYFLNIHNTVSQTTRLLYTPN